MSKGTYEGKRGIDGAAPKRRVLVTPPPVSRDPTPEEYVLVGREPGGDRVLEWAGSDAYLRELADAFECAGSCDAAHVLSGVGIYLED